ncbi:MAG: hypothetical protein HYV42_00965 [Candidatus Magasanikbacteria bacterium]|nr:hypothetical protein [Candidatus Magasanikbacteria bacterium]
MPNIIPPGDFSTSTTPVVQSVERSSKQLVDSINKLDSSTKKASIAMVTLTTVLVILTLALIWQGFKK